MSARCSGLILVFALVAVLFEAQVAYGQKSYYYKGSGYHSKEAPKCVFYPDFSTVEASLRSYIFLAQTKKAAAILSSNELFSLGAGLSYRDKETCLVVQTSTRAKDPDIVAAQALALNAEQMGDTEKLARAIVLSFETDCRCSLFTAKQKEELTVQLKAILDDPEERKIILEFGRPEESHEQHPVSNSTYGAGYHSGRRLLVTESSPTNSLVCAHCDPPNLCKDMNWCQ